MNREMELQTKVQAQNLVHERARALAPDMANALRQFIGKKVQNVGGELSAKVRSALPEDASRSPRLMFWYHASNYSVHAHFKACLTYPSNGYDAAVYAEASVLLADVRNGVLEKVYDRLPGDEFLRTDYTVEEVLAARAEMKAAREAVSRAEWKLVHFGEYDR